MLSIARPDDCARVGAGDAHERPVGHDRGRIYRVLPTDTPPRPIAKLNTLDSSRVADLLDSRNGRVRDLAQQELVARRDFAVTDKLMHLTAHGKSEMGRLHALCTLAGIILPTPDLLATALRDPSATVRRHAIRLSEPHISSTASPAPPPATWHWPRASRCVPEAGSCTRAHRPGDARRGRDPRVGLCSRRTARPRRRMDGAAPSEF